MGREVGVSHPLQTIICVFGELRKLDIILLALIVFQVLFQALGFPGDSVVKNLPANAGDTGDVGLIPGLGRSSGEGNRNPLQHSCLRNPMDRGAWHVAVHGGPEESDLTEHACSSRDGYHNISICHGLLIPTFYHFE